MSNEDYKQGYREGYDDGVAKGRQMERENAKLPIPYNPLGYPPLEGVKEKCPKCGITISGIMNYVCSSPNCPTFPQITSGLINSNDIKSFTTGQFSVADYIDRPNKLPQNRNWYDIPWRDEDDAKKYDDRGWRIE